MRAAVESAGFPVLHMEKSLDYIMPANINPNCYNGKNAIDMVISDAGSIKCVDQTIIMIGRDSDIEASLAAQRQEKIRKYKDQLKLGSIQFAPVVVSALGAEDKSFKDFIEYCSKVAKANGNNFSTKFFIARISHLLIYSLGVKTAKCYMNIKCC